MLRPCQFKKKDKATVRNRAREEQKKKKHHETSGGGIDVCFFSSCRWRRLGKTTSKRLMLSPRRSVSSALIFLSHSGEHKQMRRYHSRMRIVTRNGSEQSSGGWPKRKNRHLQRSDVSTPDFFFFFFSLPPTLSRSFSLTHTHLPLLPLTDPSPFLP